MDTSALKKIGDAFKAACDDAASANQAPAKKSSAMGNMNAKMPEFVELNAAPTKAQSGGESLRPKNMGAPQIRPVEFRKIDLAKDLG
ncbi:hypothetical protein D3C87_1540540 [compost metagenome]